MAHSIAILLLLVCGFSSSFGDYVFDLDANTFDGYVREKDVMLVDFYAPWCGHCQRLAPQLENAASQMASRNEYVFAKVDCTQTVNQELCKKYNVQGYPSLKLFKFGTFTGDYIGQRESNDIINYMESVAETTKQQSPLTVMNNPSFVNPPEFQPQPQTFAPAPAPEPPNMASYFQHPVSPNPPLFQSYYNQPKHPANTPLADQQPSIQVHAPSQALHLGASPDSLAGKFGGNMLALEILRSKLKMIAAYKNWQKRLKEYKDKMAEAARMNPYNRARVGSAKHTIRKPPKSNPVKPKAFFKRPKKYQTKKYPRTFPFDPRYQRRPFSPLKGRSAVYNRLWQQRVAASRAYQQKMAEYQKRRLSNYKRYYVPYARQPFYRPQYPRNKIARPGTVAQPQAAAFQPQPQQQIAAFQPSPQPKQVPGQPQQPESPKIQFENPQIQPVSPQQQPQNDQPQPQVTVVQPQQQSSNVQPQVPEAQSQDPVSQPLTQILADVPSKPQASAAQDQPKTPDDPLQAQVTADKAITKKVEKSNADQSITDLKHDIENAIQDALNNKLNSETKPANKTEKKDSNQVLDTTGSGSGSEIQTVNNNEGHIADASGSGSGDVSTKKTDKAGGES